MSKKTSADISAARKGRTDWARLEAMTAEDIQRQTVENPDAAPALPRDWFAGGELILPGTKRPISIRLDREVITYFMAQGRGYQSRINAVLRQYVDYQRVREALTGVQRAPRPDPATVGKPPARKTRTKPARGAPRDPASVK